MFPASQTNIASFPCPACGIHLSIGALDQGAPVACPRCRVELEGRVFPAWEQPSTLAGGLADHAMDGDAVCFFHPENRASLSCERCGRFICNVCDMPLGTRHVCPTCLSSGLSGEKLQELVAKRVVWSNAAFWAGLVPFILFFLWFLFIITGPLTIFCVLFGWKKPGSLPRGRRRWLAVIGLILGLLQIAAWISIVFAVSHAINSSR